MLQGVRRERNSRRQEGEREWREVEIFQIEFCVSSVGERCVWRTDRGELCVPLSDRSALSLSLTHTHTAFLLSFWVRRAPLQAVYDAITTVLGSASFSESGKSHQFHSHFIIRM